MKITNLYAREILDSRGNPTVECELTTENFTVRASVPSGASTGTNEALELRDGDSRYHGKGVTKAVNNVNTIIKNALIGKELNQKVLDNLLLELDGTKNKTNLGANAILSVSLCIMKAIAKSQNKDIYELFDGPYTMPYPMMNIINGGVHATSSLEIQEFMIVPNQSTFKERLRCGAEVFQTLKSILKQNGFSTSVGDEGGFAPTFKTIEEALDYIMLAIKESGYIPGKDVNLALDAAASEFYKDGKYTINKKELTKEELINYYIKLTETYPIISIEDAFSEDDIDSIKKLTELIGNKIMLVGDDYFVTNIEYSNDSFQLERIAHSTLKTSIKVDLINLFSAKFVENKIKYLSDLAFDFFDLTSIFSRYNVQPKDVEYWDNILITELSKSMIGWNEMQRNSCINMIVQAIPSKMPLHLPLYNHYATLIERSLKNVK